MQRSRRRRVGRLVRVGVDTGGTYTDFRADVGGRAWTWKVPSTPREPREALAAGLAALREALGSQAAPPILEVVYGSTLATNALLEGRGARVALVTTAGFEDVLELGRQARPQLYALHPQRPPPPVPAARRFGVHEAIEPDGRIRVPLDPAEVVALLPRLDRARVEAIAVSLLMSFVQPRHEKLVASVLQRHGWLVSRSSALWPEMREYERTQTTVLNAMLQPVVGPVLERLAGVAATRSFTVMQSNGGRCALSVASREPVRLLLSGPAGGVRGAWEVARRHGLQRVVALDMGGTSTDVALLDGGLPERLPGATVAGYEVALPILDIHTVGAGGGSLARRDAGGALRVGPESAGADPGPACLGRGTRPTVTDAHVVLGRLPPAHYLGGRIRLDRERAIAAMRELGAALGTDTTATALGILRVAHATMAGALRAVSVERGVDPRAAVLLAYGGAGPLHAAELVRDLEMRAALIPAEAAVLSAFGMARAPYALDLAATCLRTLPVVDLERRMARLEGEARRRLARQGVQRVRVERRAELRYRGQSFTLTLPLRRDLEAAFHRRHEERFGFAARGEPVELVTLRVHATSPAPGARTARVATVPAGARVAKGQGNRDVVTLPWPGRRGVTRRRTPVIAAGSLPVGRSHRGPLLLWRDDTTIAVPPDFTVRAVAGGDLWLQRGEKATHA